MGYTIDVSVSGSENPKEILANGNTSPDNTQIDAKAAIEQIDASNFESIKTGIQKMKPLLDAFEKLSPEKSLAAEGTIGALLLDRLQASGLHVQIQNGNIRVLSSNPADQSYATQLETFFRSEVGMNQILGVGMMYRTSEYQKYAKVYLDKDNNVNPVEKSNYVQYLNNAKKLG